MKPFEGDYYTQVKKETEVYVEGMETQRQDARASSSASATVSVSEQVIAYQRKRLGDNKVIDIVSLDLPEQDFVTQALWYVIGDRMAAALPSEVLLGALHASEHGQIAVLPLIAMCDRWDIGGLSTNIHHQTGSPTIFIYDGHPGGVGITRRGYEEFERLVGDADRLIRECPCDDGCPSCVQSPKCGNLNEHLHKGGALELMGRMLAEEKAARRTRRVSRLGADGLEGIGFGWKALQAHELAVAEPERRPSRRPRLGPRCLGPVPRFSPRRRPHPRDR